MRPSWMLAHLAQQTRQHHAAADGDRLAILEMPNDERYRQWLGKIYCFEAPIEAACIGTPDLAPSILRTHIKTPRLERDLDVLGLVAREVVMPVAFDSSIDALGWLYVVQRNTLLHGLIYRYLAGKLPASLEHAGSYLATFEGRAGTALRELGDALHAVARRGSIVERIVAAANEAFRVQRQWYSCDFIFPQRPHTSRPSQAA